MKLTYIIKPSDNYLNVKELLKAYFSISDRLLFKLRKNGKIFLNGIVANINSHLLPMDTVEVLIDFEEDSLNIVPTKMNLNIIYENEEYIIVNKDPGLPIHPSMNHYTDSLSNGIKYYFNSHRINEIKKRISIYWGSVI